VIPAPIDEWIPGNADSWIKEQPHFQDSSPDRETSLIPSAAHHADVERPPLTSLQGREPEFYRNIVRIGKILKDEEEHDSQFRTKLTELGYTTKELETLKRTGKHNFEIRRQDINNSSSGRRP
jgi:hypothetical protein